MQSNGAEPPAARAAGAVWLLLSVCPCLFVLLCQVRAQSQKRDTSSDTFPVKQGNSLSWKC